MHTQSRPRDKRAGAQAHYIFIIFRQKPLIYNMRASARVSELCTRIRLIGPRIQIQFKWYFLLLTRARRSVLTQRCSSLTIEYQSNAHETLVEYIHRVYFLRVVCCRCSSDNVDYRRPRFAEVLGNAANEIRLLSGLGKKKNAFRLVFNL